jgi:hypothetical protein
MNTPLATPSSPNTADPSATRGPAAPAKLNITVLYAGLTTQLTITLQQALQAVLQQALNAFDIQANRHLLSLYTADGVELADAQHVAEVGIKNGDQLLLRPSQVRGGTASETLVTQLVACAGMGAHATMDARSMSMMPVPVSRLVPVRGSRRAYAGLRTP